MIAANQPAPPRGTRVVDLDGRRGTIVLVTEWEGCRWYDVRFGPQGAAVRYDRDLTVIGEG